MKSWSDWRYILVSSTTSGAKCRKARALKSRVTRNFFKKALFLSGNDRRQLIQVSDKDHLYTAERLLRFGTVNLQKGVDAVQNVGTQHRNFVNYQGLQSLINSFGSRRDLK